MKILLLGPQGSGKGTVGSIISQKTGLPIIGVGDLLRNLDKNHPRYNEIQEIMSLGELAPQDFVAELIKERVSKEDCKNGFILDGWGRSLIDLEYFDPGYDKVLVINLSRESSIKRITGRRICSTDGKTYNIFTLPKEELEKCKGELLQRSDDTEEAVNKRLDIYYSETQKLIDFFKNKNKVVEVDGEPLPEVVADSALKALGFVND